jgi:hypothetical protein
MAKFELQFIADGIRPLTPRSRCWLKFLSSMATTPASTWR